MSIDVKIKNNNALEPQKKRRRAKKNNMLKQSKLMRTSDEHVFSSYSFFLNKNIDLTVLLPFFDVAYYTNSKQYMYINV